jgi:hypothetical protein
MYTIICFKELKQLGISYLLEDGTKKLGHVPLSCQNFFLDLEKTEQHVFELSSISDPAAKIRLNS